MLEGGLHILWKVMSVTLEFSTVTKDMIQHNSGGAEGLHKAAEGSSG